MAYSSDHLCSPNTGAVKKKKVPVRPYVSVGRIWQSGASGNPAHVQSHIHYLKGILLYLMSVFCS